MRYLTTHTDLCIQYQTVSFVVTYSKMHCLRFDMVRLDQSSQVFGLLIKDSSCACMLTSATRQFGWKELHDAPELSKAQPPSICSSPMSHKPHLGCIF